MCIRDRRDVVDAMPRSIKDPALTATWEEALNMIAHKQYDPAEFMEKIEGYVQRLIDGLKQLPPNKRVSHAPAITRPAAAQKAEPGTGKAKPASARKPRGHRRTKTAAAATR
ncbi:MAG: hypothetical protein N2690_11010, partial [Rhodocyclaceae bacterium]|nr:hypothetical protein [Rhodocyclaceae bacterium]